MFPIVTVRGEVAESVFTASRLTTCVSARGTEHLVNHKTLACRAPLQAIVRQSTPMLTADAYDSLVS